MADIKEISTEELQTDLAESLTDIEVCKWALLQGVKWYNNKLVEDRLKVNQLIVEVISAELRCRNCSEKIISD